MPAKFPGKTIRRSGSAFGCNHCHRRNRHGLGFFRQGFRFPLFRFRNVIGRRRSEPATVPTRSSLACRRRSIRFLWLQVRCSGMMKFFQRFLNLGSSNLNLSKENSDLSSGFPRVPLCLPCVYAFCRRWNQVFLKLFERRPASRWPWDHRKFTLGTKKKNKVATVAKTAARIHGAASGHSARRPRRNPTHRHHSIIMARPVINDRAHARVAASIVRFQRRYPCIHSVAGKIETSKSNSPSPRPCT